MRSTIPEDVYSEIANSIMAFSKETQGEEREALRKLRDSTLLNLALTSRGASSVSLQSLYRNVNVSPVKSKLILSNLRTGSSPFINTRSLRFGISHSQAEMQGMDDRDMLNVDEAEHPDLDSAVRIFSEPFEELSRLLAQNAAVPKPLEKMVVAGQFYRSASILSIIIESMPNLELLELSRWANFYFAKLDRNPETRARFSRPLLGLSSLRILKIGESALREINAANCVWLMLFLPKLTYFKAHIWLLSTDVKFFEDHQEVLAGKSRVTHLELEFLLRPDKEAGWPEQTFTEVDILEKLLSVTNGLIELKLRNTSIPGYRAIMASSLLFLRSLKTSFDSLKYLCLVGDFTERLMDMEAEHRKRNPPIPFNLKSLEMISFDCLSTRALGRPEEKSRIKLNFPSLKLAHSHAGQDLEDNPFPLPWIEVTFMTWIKSKSFPPTVKEIILDEKPLDVDGRVVDLGENRTKWEKERTELLSLCREKCLEVKILKEGEQIPFGVMPEPEDLF